MIQQKVSENWLRYEVDPKITTAQRVYITFDIGRDGHPFNVQTEQSSGVPALDISATRALQRIERWTFVWRAIPGRIAQFIGADHDQTIAIQHQCLRGAARIQRVAEPLYVA